MTSLFHSFIVLHNWSADSFTWTFVSSVAVCLNSDFQVFVSRPDCHRPVTYISSLIKRKILSCARAQTRIFQNENNYQSAATCWFKFWVVAVSRWWLQFTLTTVQIVLHNTLRTGDADLRFYITTVQEGWRKSAFLTRASFPCTVHLNMQYIEPVSEWSCWRMFIETWPHAELTFRHRASSI